MDVEQLKERSKAQWARGNYPALAEQLEPAARALVDACAISAGQEVLDVAAGTGNLAAHRRGRGRRAWSLPTSALTWSSSDASARRPRGSTSSGSRRDAEELPFEDGRFDCVASVFGAMFAPRPERAAAELFRVTRPGGTVGMATWPPGGFAAGVFEIGSRYAPGPQDVPPAVLWGEEDTVRERFEGHASRVELSGGTLTVDFPSLDAALAFYEDNAPNVATAREALDPEVYAEMREDFRGLLGRWLTPDGGVEIHNDYLLIVARKRG